KTHRSPLLPAALCRLSSLQDQARAPARRQPVCSICTEEQMSNEADRFVRTHLTAHFGVPSAWTYLLGEPKPELTCIAQRMGEACRLSRIPGSNEPGMRHRPHARVACGHTNVAQAHTCSGSTKATTLSETGAPGRVELVVVLVATGLGAVLPDGVGC